MISLFCAAAFRLSAWLAIVGRVNGPYRDVKRALQRLTQKIILLIIWLNFISLAVIFQNNQLLLLPQKRSHLNTQITGSRFNGMKDGWIIDVAKHFISRQNEILFQSFPTGLKLIWNSIIHVVSWLIGKQYENIFQKRILSQSWTSGNIIIIHQIIPTILLPKKTRTYWWKVRPVGYKL